MKEPSNETILGIELWMARRDAKNRSVTAYGTARVATELCRLGRLMKLYAERSVSDALRYEKAERQLERTRKSVNVLLGPYHAQPVNTGGGVIYSLRTKRPGVGHEQETALL